MGDICILSTEVNISKCAFVWCPEGLSATGKDTFVRFRMGDAFSVGMAFILYPLLMTLGWVGPVGSSSSGWWGREDGKVGHVFPGVSSVGWGGLGVAAPAPEDHSSYTLYTASPSGSRNFSIPSPYSCPISLERLL